MEGKLELKFVIVSQEFVVKAYVQPSCYSQHHIFFCCFSILLLSFVSGWRQNTCLHRQKCRMVDMAPVQNQKNVPVSLSTSLRLISNIHYTLCNSLSPISQLSHTRARTHAPKTTQGIYTTRVQQTPKKEKQAYIHSKRQKEREKKHVHNKRQIKREK